MSNKGNFIISLLILAIGVAFIWSYDRGTLPQYIVTLCGLAFLIPAVVNFIAIFVANSRKSASAGMRLIHMVCAIGGLGLGLVIIFLPGVFRPLLIYPFAVLMLAGGLFQVFQLSHKYRPVDYPSWMHIVPILLIVTGVVMICLPWLRNPANEHWMLLITGIAAVLFGINGILVSVLSHTMKPLTPAEKAAESKEPAAIGEAAKESATSAETAYTPKDNPSDSSASSTGNPS